MEETARAEVNLDLRDSYGEGSRLERVAAAAETWRAELVDTSGRNRLLRYRDLKTGTLNLATNTDLAVLEVLAAGATVEVADLIPDADHLDDALRRLRAIHKTSTINLEEKGLATLFLALGLATWKTDGNSAPPNAPVILVPTKAEPAGATQQSFKLTAEGDPHLNPVLRYVLDEAFGVGARIDEVLQQTLGAEDFSFGLAVDFFRRLAGVVESAPQFRIHHVPVLGNFSYVTMPMVQDLASNTEHLATNDIIAAIAGVTEARDALAARFVDPASIELNRVDPKDEFLVLDADESQQRAIARVLAGESLVVQGPPGTGKSQTISNLIGSLLARGKRVLFVAEKRAAIDAVMERLTATGLGDLVLDLHGGVTNKREFAQGLAASLDAAASVPSVDDRPLQSSLVAHRDRLDEHDEMMHRRRDEFGASVFELQTAYLGIPDAARTHHPVTANHARQLTFDQLADVDALVAEWLSLQGADLERIAPEWAASRVGTAADAQLAYEGVSSLASELAPEAQRTTAALLREAGLRYPVSLEEWSSVLGMVGSVVEILATFKPELFESDLEELEVGLSPATSKAGAMWATLTSAMYRRARSNVRDLAVGADKVSGLDAMQAVTNAKALRQQWTQIALTPADVRAPGSYEAARDAHSAFVTRLGGMSEQFPPEIWSFASFDELHTMISRAAGQRDVAARLPRIREIEAQLGSYGMAPILSDVRAGNIPSELTAHVFRHAWLQQALSEVSFHDARFASFSADQHDRIVEQFKDADESHFATAPRRIRRAVAERLYALKEQHPNEAALVQKQSAMKRRHMPVRKLLAAAPHVMLGLRPCWTMSPLLVSELVPADADLFDVVIFDEASQIRPAEAIASLARAPQAVVAGDDRQLPPTMFFARSGAGPETDDEDLALTGGAFESILDVLSAGPVRQNMLLWHYRSRDERLINFSNAHLYHGALTSFPGVVAGNSLRSEVIPFRPHPGTSTKSNPDEVERVVELAIEHATSLSELSLGVITMGQDHASRIEETLRQRLIDLANPELDDFFSEEVTDKFFVKNIERVQGDERDAIILSVGYHKNANGTLPYRFGPLLQEGGERRLNVAITRARTMLTLVSSFDHRDMDPNRSKAEGVRLLRQYFEYVQSGGEQLGSEVTDVALNPFEMHVHKLLTAQGVPLTPQFGVSGYRIDFAAAHPSRPGEMVLAIEADGASYHSSATARERDRLREQVLRNLGWSVHRIWSTEWFRDPARETDRAVEAWREAVRRADGALVELAPSRPAVDSPTAETPTRRQARPRMFRGEPITTYTDRELVNIVSWVTSDTLLRTDEELMAETMREMGYKRRGKRIEAALTKAILAYRRASESAPAP